MLRRIITTLVAVFVVGVAAPGIAQAGPTTASVCSGYGCDNADPYETGCDDDAFVANSKFVSSANWIELWYSPFCGTAWAQTGAVGFEIKVVSYYSDGRYRMTVSSHTTQYVRYSRMVYDPVGLRAEACELLPATGGQGWVCTDRF